MQNDDDFLRATARRDPHAFYRRVRAHAPFAYDGRLRLWVATGADAVDEVLRHPALRVRPPAEPVPAVLRGTPTGEVFALLVRMNDGDFHVRHRPAVVSRTQTWSARAVADAAAAAVADLAPGREVDALLSEVPVQAVARLLGVPRDALDATVAAAHAFTRAIAPGASVEARALGDAAVRDLMAQGESEGLDRAASANRLALLQQALDATAGLIGNALARLVVQPQEAALAGEGLAWITELARWDPAIHHTRRYAAEDANVAGVRVPAGDGLLVVLAAAARDPARYQDPDVFRLGRHASCAPAFGAGPHACPGERIALTLAAAALRALLARPGFLAALPEPQAWRPLPNARIPVFFPS